MVLRLDIVTINGTHHMVHGSLARTSLETRCADTPSATFKRTSAMPARELVLRIRIWTVEPFFLG